MHDESIYAKLKDAFDYKKYQVIGVIFFELYVDSTAAFFNYKAWLIPDYYSFMAYAPLGNFEQGLSQTIHY